MNDYGPPKATKDTTTNTRTTDNTTSSNDNTTTVEDGRCELQVLGFPCNQFGYQEPAENFELMNCIKYVRPGWGYEPNFPLFGKLNVNGQDESPIFTFLKARCPSPMGMIANRTDITWTPIRNNDVSWNFSKWLIDHLGQPYRRYTPRTEPDTLMDDIDKLLYDCNQRKAKKSKRSIVSTVIRNLRSLIHLGDEPSHVKRN